MSYCIRLFYEMLKEKKLGEYEIKQLKTIRKRIDHLIMENERRYGDGKGD